MALELGRRTRTALGDALQPALGWDSGKFTAHAAATQTTPGRARLVDKADEVRFLAPLSITLLPLPRAHLQQLHWLGIRTLGQFAALPAAAVWQRFGAAGKLAQRWAQGKDERPVQAGVAPIAERASVTLDPPATLLRPVVDALMTALQAPLARWAEALRGLRHLRVTLDFTGDARPMVINVTFVEPASQPGRVQAALVQQLCAQPWPGALQRAHWQALATGELAAHQLSLFDDPLARLAAPDTVAAGLTDRYRASLFYGRLVDPLHPLAERRSHYTSL